METAALRIAQLKVVGVFNLAKSRVTKEDVGQLVKKKHEELRARLTGRCNAEDVG